MRLMGWSAMRESTSQVAFGIEAIEFCRADQTVDCSGAFTASVRPREQVILPIMERFT